MSVVVDGAADPAEVGADVAVDARRLRVATARAVGHDADDVPQIHVVAGSLDHQGAAAVILRTKHSR